MANHKSAAKRARQSIVRTKRNKATKSAMRTQSKKVEDAADQKTANAELGKASRLIQRAARKGAMSKKTAARRQSKLARTANAKK